MSIQAGHLAKGLQARKGLVRRFLETYSICDPDDTMSLLSADFEFRIMARSSSLPLVLVQRRAEFRQILVATLAMFPAGVVVRVGHIIAEGDWVAAEAFSFADMGDGRLYENLYHFKVHVRDGMICEVREYCDFLHVSEAIFVSPGVDGKGLMGDGEHKLS